MAKIYLISDTHWDDFGEIIRYEGRPFKDGEEMNITLIENWNQVVEPDDIIYHLGDFSSNCDVIHNRAILDKLNGHKRLIMGNHDRHLSVKEWIEAGFEEAYPLPVILNDFFILSHEPCYVSVSSPYANIFGHVHGNPAYKDYSSRSYCVCVERIGYAPILLDNVKHKIIQECEVNQ